MRPWPSIRNKSPSVQREFRGINLLDAFSINDSFSTDTLNFTSEQYPALSVRPGFSVLGNFGRVLGMGVWKESELHVVTADGKWRRLNAGNSTWTELASGLSTSAEWTFTNFKGNLSTINLIGSNGVDPAKVYNGSTVSTLSGVPAGAKYITQFSDRLFAAIGNELKYSAYRMADDWTTVNGDDADSGYIIIETPDGEEINSIQAGMSRLTITKPSSVHGLFGYSPADYTMRPMTLDIGQFNHKSGATLDGWLYQLYSTGFYRFPGSGLPQGDFSERIKSFFARIPLAARTASALGTDGHKLYLSFSTSGVLPDTTIEYDPAKDTFFPWSFGAVDFAKVGDAFYVADSTGRILKLGGSTDSGSTIFSRWVSKPFAAGSLSQGVRWTNMWITASLPAGSSLTVSLSKDGVTWEQVGAVNAATSIVRQRLVINSARVLSATYIWYKIEGSGPYTIHEVAWEPHALPLR